MCADCEGLPLALRHRAISGTRRPLWFVGYLCSIGCKPRDFRPADEGRAALIAEFVNLIHRGPVGYHKGWDLQREVHSKVSTGAKPTTLILLEHSSVYTAGKRSDMSEFPSDGSEFVETDRGGKVTWHGPGQLIGYPIYRLPDPVDVVSYVRSLESLMMEALERHGLSSHRVAGRSGVWVGESGVERKIAAIGIRVSNRTTMHGFALNVSNSLEPYEVIIPCGIADAGVTTVEQELGSAPALADIAHTIEEAFGGHFS